MFNTEPFIADLRRVYAATCPELTAIYDAEHVEMIPWLDLALPYGVILIESLPAADWGMGCLAFEPDVHLFYVASTRGKAVSLRGKLTDLVNAFWPTNPLTTGSALDVAGVSWSDALPPNETFRSANRLQRAGMLSLRCLVGVRV